MQRRVSLKLLSTLSSGMILLPSWAEGWHKKDIKPSIIFNSKESKIISSLVDTYLPKTKAVGGLDVGVPIYLEKLFSDCYENNVQQQIKYFLKSVEVYSKSKFQIKFKDLPFIERKNILLALKNDPTTDLKTMDLIKSDIIRGFTTSEVVMTVYHGFEIAPGHFHGCVNVTI